MSVNARRLLVLFASLFVVSIAAGDIRISHAYYTEGGDISEGIDLQNVDYANQVSIYQDSLFASADASLSDVGKKGIFSSRIMAHGEGSTFGSQLNAEVEKEFNYGQSLATGFRASDYITIDHSLSDGSTNARYFTNGGSVDEDVVVDSVEYVNSAKIVTNALQGSATADLLDGLGHLADNIVVRSVDGPFGTSLTTDAETTIHAEKSFCAGLGTAPKTDVTYAFEQGASTAEYYNQHASVLEWIETDSSRYQATINNAADKLRSSGQGTVTQDEYSDFTQMIQMRHSGVNCITNAWLETGYDAYGNRPDEPVQYIWNTLVNSDESTANDLIVIQAVNGNRDIDFAIEGKADGLSDNVAGPSHLTPLGYGDNPKMLYMYYEITR